jgi:hypothetical protein
MNGHQQPVDGLAENGRGSLFLGRHQVSIQPKSEDE